MNCPCGDALQMTGVSQQTDLATEQQRWREDGAKPDQLIAAGFHDDGLLPRQNCNFLLGSFRSECPNIGPRIEYAIGFAMV